MRFAPRHGLVLAAAGIAVALLSGCAAPTAKKPADPTTTATTAPSRDLTVRISLSTDHVAAGTAIPASLIVTNHRSETIDLDAGGCRPSFVVALTRKGFPPEVALPADCSRRPFLIHPGVNRLPTTVSTRYGRCSQAISQVSDASPACLPGPELMPPLPPGHYRAVLVTDSRTLPVPPGVAVTLSPSPVWVPPEFRPACGHPGAHVEVTKVPVTVRHAVCDLTGVLITYKDYGGAYVSIKGGSISNSSGFTLTVDPRTEDVTIDATGVPGNA